jgi:hypothetical protein
MPFEQFSAVPGNRSRVPAPTTPAGRPFRVALVYKNWARSGSNHIGLGVTALNTAKYLRAMGIYCDVWGITDMAGLAAKIKNAESNPAGIHALTHVVISAPFLPSADLQDMAILNPHIGFAAVCHSNVAFLAVDPNGFRLSREYTHVERSTTNFHMAVNCTRLTSWIINTYARPCWIIPNLYMLDGTTNPHRPPYSGGTIRFGCFGATRTLKNILTAGAAALEIGSLNRQNIEFWISTGRAEGAGGTFEALRQMFEGVPAAELKELPWQEWSKFRDQVRHMHLLLQPSFTESFNVVTADGIAEGVPSVVGPAIAWVPEDWKASADDSSHIAQVGRRLLLDHKAPAEGLAALVAYNNNAFGSWETFLHDTTAHM